MRQIADKLGSPNRLSGDLLELVQRRLLHVDRPNGKEHIYTITKGGISSLVKYETNISDASVARLSGMDLPRESLVKLLNKLKTRVKITWCDRCGGNQIDIGYLSETDEEIEVCGECHNGNMMHGTLADYEAFIKKYGLKAFYDEEE